MTATEESRAATKLIVDLFIKHGIFTKLKPQTLAEIVELERTKSPNQIDHKNAVFLMKFFMVHECLKNKDLAGAIENYE